MRTKDTSVQCAFHPALTAFLFGIGQMYQDRWNSELIITSGSEPDARHSLTSLHYATPCQAVDIRSWDINLGGRIYRASDQAMYIKEAAEIYCANLGIPSNWIEVIVETDHIHIEYQPKRTF